MSNASDREAGAGSANGDRKSNKLLDAARRTDSLPGLVATAKFVRRLLPGDRQYGDALSTTGDDLPQHIGRAVAEPGADRPSAVRELGLGALQAWQALSETQRRGRGTVDLAILFTDLVEFSSWALEVGDETALELLREVGAIENNAIEAHEGTLVKWLGDGAMAVFERTDQALLAAFEAQRALADVECEGYKPEIRAGVHVGRPRKVGRDYLGVDVNIASRVGDAAKGGQVLISERGRDSLTSDAFSFGRRRRLKAAGAPKQLSVYAVELEGAATGGN